MNKVAPKGVLLQMLILQAATTACAGKGGSKDGQAQLSQRLPTVVDGTEVVPITVTASENARGIAAASVAGRCETGEYGRVVSCVDYELRAYDAQAAQTVCQQMNPNNIFTPGAACSHARSSGGCVSTELNTTTWYYLARDESPGSRPAPTCDGAQAATPP